MPSVSKRLSSLFLLITAIGAVHMGEQLIFGIEEYYMLRDGIGGWFHLFPAEFAGHASVALITLVFLSISLMLYGLMRGGAAALIVLGSFGVLGVQEGHHVIEAIESGAYDPGLITSIAYVWVGWLILAEVWREFRARKQARAELVAA
jgi:hypothetical protein